MQFYHLYFCFVLVYCQSSNLLFTPQGVTVVRTAPEFDTIVINSTNFNQIKHVHYIPFVEPHQAKEAELKELLNFDTGKNGPYLVSDIGRTTFHFQEEENSQNDIFITLEKQEYEQEYEQELNYSVCPNPLDYNFIPGIPRSNIFNELSKQEILNIGDFISSVLGYWWQGNNPQIDHFDHPKPNDTNILVSIQLYPPYKEEAVEYLDGNIDTPPPRFAKVVVVRGIERDVMEYKIGPLPLRKGEIIWEELTAPGQIPYAKRPQFGMATAWIEYVIDRTAFYLRDIFKDMTGGHCFGITYWAADIDYDELTSRQECGYEEEWKIDWQSYPVQPKSRNDTVVERLTRVVWYFYPANGTYNFSHGDEGGLHPIPLSFTVNETHPDYKSWTALEFEYCGQYFENKESLLTSFQQKSIFKCGASEWGFQNYDWNWALTYNSGIWKTRTPRITTEFIAGPHSYEPQNHRYSIVGSDTYEGRRFSWMGWEGHLTLRPDTGIALYDIRFNKERIIYELSLQEQYTAYSGFTGAGQGAYFESSVGLGMTSNPLRHGLDCPESAVYFSQTKLYGNGAVWVNWDVICMFEVDMAETEWRHAHLKALELVGIRRTQLVIRSISTISNTDYIFDVRFNLDASINVQINQAGYMEALFFDPQHHTMRDMPFGTRVGKHTLANIHDHLSGWKVDLDVKGRNNTFEKQTVKYGTYKDAFAKHPDLKDEQPPAWFDQLSLKYIDLEKIEQEVGLRIYSDKPAVWHFVNEASPNKWGNPQGYVIMPEDTDMQVMNSDHPLLQAASWTKYHLAVTKHKDHEYVSHASVYDTYLPQMPVRSLDQYIDGENIVNTDLVGWVMVGAVHIPRTEDLPVVSNSAYGFSIKPWNYFDELVSLSVYEQTNFSMNCVPLGGKNFEYSWAFDN